MREEYKIMIVEDVALHYKMLRRILLEGPAKERNITIVKATSGKEAIEKLEDENIDLILLDIVMPDMDGFEVLSLLKKSETTKFIPVILITALGDEKNEEKGLLLGAVDYIAKPFNKALVTARIRTHLRIVEYIRTIKWHSYIDPLTGIANRRGFGNHFDREWKRAVREKKSIALMVIDLDHFKKFNDTLGHWQGDVALRVVADIISSSARRPEDLAARWGGEEFAVLLPGTPLKGALQVAEELRERIEKAKIPQLDQNGSVKVMVSIGVVSHIPLIGSSTDRFFDRADKALYLAKHTGRNKVCSYIDVIHARRELHKHRRDG